MEDYKSAFDAIVKDARYCANLDWGEPRPGHPEATIREHIAEIEQNLESLRPRLTDTDYWKLRILIHTHDTFKPDASPGVPISDPMSHASLAGAFLADHCQDADLLAMVQHHDEPFALWRQFEAGGQHDADRLTRLFSKIADWNLFLVFNIVDGCTVGKSRDPLRWFFAEVHGKVKSSFTAEDIL